MDFVKTLSDISDNSNIKHAEGDYEGENGLLYCGKCNSPKQCEIRLNGRVLRPYCLCECEAKAVKLQEDSEKAENLKEEIERTRKSGFPDPELMQWTFAIDDRANEKASDISLRYCTHFLSMKDKGKGILYLGNCGTGKTFLAACIANELINQGFSVLMTNFSRLVNIIFGLKEGKQNYIDSLNNYDLLIIDDLGVERQSEYVAEIVQNIVDSRYRAGLPLIITTNLTPKDFSAESSDIAKSRLYSRISEMCLPVVVSGVDRRKKNSAACDSELKKLLGL
jgi:DNA replication protein DnaC